MALAAACTVASPAAERPWRELNTGHYRVISQLDEQQTVAWAHEFDQFIATSSDLLSINTSYLPPLTVLLFASGQDLDSYRPTGAGAPLANAGGEFVRRQTWNLAAIAGDRIDDGLRQQIFHDATLWLLSADESRQPAWFAAGMADQLATFNVHNKQAQWAKPNEAYLKTLHDNDNAYMLQDLLAQPATLFQPDTRSELFHAQAWGFTHFMLYSGTDSMAKLVARFLATFKTRSGAATVSEVFGKDLSDIALEFHKYVTRQRFGTPSAGLKATPDLPAAAPATAGTVEAALGFLALGTGRNELAQQHASRAVELDPAAPGGHEVLAYLSLEAKDLRAAADHARNALEHGSKDSAMYMVQADELAADHATGADSVRERLDLYERAINLNPRRTAPYEQLTSALLEFQQPTAEDGKFLEVGQKVFPGDDWIRVGSALVAAGLGHADQARSAFDQALQPGSTLDDEQRSAAQRMSRSLQTKQ